MWKWEYWSKGIPAYMFYNEKLKDIKDIMDINNTIAKKGIREKKIKEAMSKVRF